MAGHSAAITIQSISVSVRSLCDEFIPGMRAKPLRLHLEHELFQVADFGILLNEGRLS
jgi:hypothetical protein